MIVNNANALLSKPALQIYVGTELPLINLKVAVAHSVKSQLARLDSRSTVSYVNALLSDYNV